MTVDTLVQFTDNLLLTIGMTYILYWLATTLIAGIEANADADDEESEEVND